MALRRGRNIESLLANRSEDAGSRLSDFGEQGREARVDGRLIQEYFTARGKPKNYQYSPSEAREAMNYFKAVDKSNSPWEGGKSPFLQGPSSYDETFKYKDAILGAVPDSEALEEAAMDVASDKQYERESRINKIGSSGPSVFKQKYSDSETLDDLATDEASKLRAGVSKIDPSGPNIYNLKARMDSEALDDLAMDEASARTSRIDKISSSGPGMQSKKYTQNFGPGGVWDSEAVDDFVMDEASEKQFRADKVLQGKEASRGDFGGEEGGGFWNEAMGLLDSDSIGTEKKTYRDVDTEGDNRYLNKLARERFAEQKDMSKRLDLPGISEKISGQYSPELSADQYRDRVQKELGATWRAESDENALDALARTEPGRLKAERAKEIAMADFKGEEEGSGWDKFKGLFASDSIGRDESLEQEKKDNEELSGKIGAAAKLFSLLKPETPQAAPTIPAARITRGSVAFPGMQLASQRERRKYFTPKGLMA